jgi:phospholipid/cholesterol/gamma-HCH transport system substrate-binding protein
MHNDTVETLIGAAVIAIAVIFVIFAYRSTGTANVGGYELSANMSRVDGLAIGTDVRLSGLKVGTVNALTLEPNYLIKVHMDIQKDVKVPDDSSLIVTSSSFLGSSYLSISPGGSDKMLPPGGVIRNTQGAVDTMGLINKFVGSGSSGSGGGNSSNEAPATPKP